MPATISMLQLQSAGQTAGPSTAQGRVDAARGKGELAAFPELLLGQSAKFVQGAGKTATAAVETQGTGFDLSPVPHAPVNGSDPKSTIGEAVNGLNELKSHATQLAVQLPVQIAGSLAQAPLESQDSMPPSQATKKPIPADRDKPGKGWKEALQPADVILLSSATNTAAQLTNEPVLSSARGSGETMGTPPAPAKEMWTGSDKIFPHLERAAATQGEPSAHPLPMKPPEDALLHTATQARVPAGVPAPDSAVPDGEANPSGNFADALNRPVQSGNTRGQIQASISGRAVADGQISAPRNAAPPMALDIRQPASVGAVSLSDNAAVVNASNAVHSSSFAGAHESVAQDPKDDKDIWFAPVLTAHSKDVHAAPTGSVLTEKPRDSSVVPVAGTGFPGPVAPINIGRAAAVQDAPSHTNPHMLLDENPLAAAASWHVSANRLEAGVALHGKEWITVEASRQGGMIKAALNIGASSEHRSLETMLSGLGAHLEERQVRVGSLAMLTKYGQPSGSMADAGNGGTGTPPNQQSSRETRTTQRSNEPSRASATEEALDNTPPDGQVAVGGRRHTISYQA